MREGRKARRSCTILQEKDFDAGVVAEAGCAPSDLLCSWAADGDHFGFCVSFTIG